MNGTFSWSLAPHPTVTPAPQVQDTIETLPAAPDLNLPDPDVLVNQLGMLVTAAEGESLRNEPRTNQGKSIHSFCAVF